MPNGDYSEFVGEGLAVKRRSIQYKRHEDGTLQETGGWLISTREDEERQRALEEYIKGLFEGHSPATKVKAPKYPFDLKIIDLMQLFAWGDPHIGLYAWEQETGNKFDLEIVERLMIESIAQAVKSADNADEALLATVGDTYHVDNFSNQTPKGGNALDAAGRYEEILRLGGRIFRRSIDLIIKKFRVCHVKIVPGNHDPASTAALRMALMMVYENEPRVVIDPAPTAFQWHRFGANLIGFNHGHRVKPTELALTMAADCSDDWSACPNRYFYTGHVHHETRKEIHKVKIETLNTLAGSDGYHREGGYRSVRSMRIDTYHRRWGRINEATRGVGQIIAEMGAA
jgi:hypothetical protein